MVSTPLFLDFSIHSPGLKNNVVILKGHSCEWALLTSKTKASAPPKKPLGET